jgi:hypothetical protein
MSFQPPVDASRKPPLSKKYKAPHPGSSRVSREPDVSLAHKAVYLLGSYAPVTGGWLARNRGGEPLGHFPSETAAIDAIDAAAGDAR